MADQPRYTDTIQAFFASYPAFCYNAKAESPGTEFARLCKLMRWKKGDPVQEAAWEDYQNAVAKMFNQAYGTDAESLGAWQRLCKTLRPNDPVPDTLESARETVFNTHVNLMDLAMVHTGRKVHIWETEARLADYTRCTERIVSASSPAAGGILKALLRHIFSPPDRDLRRDQFGKYVLKKHGAGGAKRARRKRAKEPKEYTAGGGRCGRNTTKEQRKTKKRKECPTGPP